MPTQLFLDYQGLVGCLVVPEKYDGGIRAVTKTRLSVVWKIPNGLQTRGRFIGRQCMADPKSCYRTRHAAGKCTPRRGPAVEHEAKHFTLARLSWGTPGPSSHAWRRLQQPRERNKNNRNESCTLVHARRPSGPPRRRGGGASGTSKMS